MSYNSGVDWDTYVYSEAFSRKCIALAKIVSSRSVGGPSHGSAELWDDTLSSTGSDSDSHDGAQMEAYLYYYGLRGRRKLGPKLIFRTSKDVFLPPSGPTQDIRSMQLLTVHKHKRLEDNNLWDTILHKLVEVLDNHGVKITSIDLVRFGWKEELESGDTQVVITPSTVWIGVVPDSTTSEVAHVSAMEILKVLEEHGVDDLEVAFRESTVHPLSGPILYAPVNSVHPLKHALDWLTTPLSLPIAGLKTLHMQGSLGFYFRVGNELYGVTARHVLFPDDEGNDLYRLEPSVPKKKVVLMGEAAFNDLLVFVQARIGTLSNTVIVLHKQVNFNRARAAEIAQAALDLAKLEQLLTETEVEIEELRKFYALLRKDWANVNDRVIGHVVWSPPITGMNPPHGYTKDVCVIKLKKRKFLPNFRGNGIDLGTEIEPGALMSLLSPREDVPSQFDYPHDRLYTLQSILGLDNFGDLNSKDADGDPTRFVIKRGPTTKTTVGRLNRFKSFQRRYGLMGHFDSFETSVLPCDSESGPFSRGGDSGSAIVGTNNDFVALLTGAAGPPHSSEITYGTPMEWLWNNVIKTEFPRAVLFFEPTVHD